MMRKHDVTRSKQETIGTQITLPNHTARYTKFRRFFFAPFDVLISMLLHWTTRWSHLSLREYVQHQTNLWPIINICCIIHKRYISLLSGSVSGYMCVRAYFQFTHVKIQLDWFLKAKAFNLRQELFLCVLIPANEQRNAPCLSSGFPYDSLII